MASSNVATSQHRATCLHSGLAGASRVAAQHASTQAWLALAASQGNAGDSMATGCPQPRRRAMQATAWRQPWFSMTTIWRQHGDSHGGSCCLLLGAKLSVLERPDLCANPPSPSPRLRSGPTAGGHTLSEEVHARPPGRENQACRALAGARPRCRFGAPFGGVAHRVQSAAWPTRQALQPNRLRTRQSRARSRH